MQGVIFGLALMSPVAASSALSAPRIEPEVRAHYPHDTGAYTQGLVLHDEVLFESTGLFGRSTLRRVDLGTGTIQELVDLPAEEFGEGLAFHAGRLIQLTFQSGRAHVYDAETLRKVDELRYDGQGWGLCGDGRWLIMSDGSDELILRDPETFDILDTLRSRWGSTDYAIERA